MTGGDWAWLGVLLAGCGGALLAVRRIEPHWSAADGSAFSCFVQRVSADGHPEGRWREGRAEVVGERVRIRPRLLVRLAPAADTLRVVARGTGGGDPAAGGAAAGGEPTGRWDRGSRSPRRDQGGGGRRRAVFVLQGDERREGYLAVRVPAGSPARARLDALAG